MLRSQFVDQKLSISIKEARKILGKDAANLTDNQVKDLILELSFIAEYFLQSVTNIYYE